MFLGTGLTFLAALLAARSLGPASYGAVVLAVSLVGSLASLLDLSLEEAVVHFGARLLQDSDPAGLRALLRTSFKLDVVVGLGVIAVLLLVASPLAEFAGRGRLAPVLIQVAALEALVVTTNSTTGAALLVSGRPELRAWASTWTGFLRAISVGTAIAAGGGEVAVLWGYVVSSAAGAASQAVLAHRQMRRAWGPGPGRAGVSPVSLRRLAGFAANSSVTTTVIAVRVGLIAVILGRAAGPASVGLFNIAMLPVTIVGIATAPLRMTSFPEQSRLVAEGRRDDLWHSVKLSTSLGLSIGVLGAGAGYFLLPWLIRVLFSGRYAAAATPARILLIAAVAALAFAWAKALPAAVGRPSVRTILSVVELGLTVICVALLADRGEEGAAIAVSAVSVVMGCAWWLVARRMLAGMNRRQGERRGAADA